MKVFKELGHVVRGLAPARQRFRRAWPLIDRIDGLLVSGQELWLFEQAARLARGATIVEIGSYKGRSTACLGLGMKHKGGKIFAIDTFNGNDSDFQGPGRRDFFPEWHANMVKCGLTDMVTPVVGDSGSAGVDWTAPIDFLFIDGSHVYEDARRDFDMFYPHVVRGGLVALHDVGSHEGPTAVWEERRHLLERSGRLSTLAYGYKSSGY